jgi:hypothetical protein
VGTLPREEDGVRVLCSLCLLREDVELYDRNFGGGVPGLIAQECYALRDMLHEKQRAYGNSALDPIRIFSKADPEEGLRVRLDDKLSRLARGSAAGEDTIQDLLGYLILLRVARRLRPETP